MNLNHKVGFSMRTFFSTVFIIGMSLCLTNCRATTTETPEVPDFKLPTDVQDILNKTFTCDKKESEIPVSDEAEENLIVVKDKIESQDIEKIDCDGKVQKTHGPIRHLTQALSIDPPKIFADDVTFVKVENVRTCAIQAFDAKESLSETTVTGEDGQTYQNPVLSSEADLDGKIRVLVDDSDVKLNLFTNVKDGTNLLKISYFGKCLKKAPTTNEKPKSEAYHCQEAELLGTKEVLLKVEVDRPEIPGTQKHDWCFKPKK